MFIIFLTRVRYKTVLILIIDTSDLVIRTTPNQSVTSAVFCVSQMGGSNLPRPHLVIFYFFPSA